MGAMGTDRELCLQNIEEFIKEKLFDLLLER